MFKQLAVLLTHEPEDGPEAIIGAAPEHMPGAEQVKSEGPMVLDEPWRGYLSLLKVRPTPGPDSDPRPGRTKPNPNPA